MCVHQIKLRLPASSCLGLHTQSECTRSLEIIRKYLEKLECK